MKLVLLMEQLFKPNDPQNALKHFQNKLLYTTGPMELDHVRKRAPIQIIDVRAREDFLKGHIPGAVSLPEDEWDTFRGLSKNRLNVLYCYSHVCHLAARAAVEFASVGYPVMELDGGYDAWETHELETEKGESTAPISAESRENEEPPRTLM